MISHPIFYDEIPETMLFLDLADNRQEPEIMKAHNMSKLVSLGSLKALSVDPIDMLFEPLPLGKVQQQLDILYAKVASHPHELYYVMMVGMVNLQAQRKKEALEAFEYIREIHTNQPQKFSYSHDNNIVFALTRYFLHQLNIQGGNPVEVWKSIKPTLMVRIVFPETSSYYIKNVKIICGSSSTWMIESECGSFLLPQDFSLSLCLNNVLRMHIQLEDINYQTFTAHTEVDFSISYGFMRNNRFDYDFSLKFEI